jgi:ribose/xylose/arabinose/galactoside ABC-type transport system permease subunit
MTAINEPDAQATRNFDFAGLLQRFGALGFFFGALVIIAASSAPVFFTELNLLTVLRNLALGVGIMAVGMLFVIITRRIDFSAGSIAALGSVVSAYLIVFSGYNAPVAILLAVLGGAACGGVIGVSIAYLKWPSSFVSLAAMLIARQASGIISGDRLMLLGDGGDSLRAFGRGLLFGLPEPFVLILAVFLVGGIVLNYTRLGRVITAIGSNEEAVRLSGIAVPRYIVAVYVISGGLASAAGVLCLSRMGGGSRYLDEGAVFGVIAAVVIGGSGLRGGHGGVVTTLLGVLVVGGIANLLAITGVSSYWRPVCMLLIIAIALLIQFGARSLRR